MIQPYPSKWNKIFRKDLIRLLTKRNIIDSSCDDLENLHLYIDRELFDYSMDKGVNPLTIDFYDTDDIFLEIYYKFLQDLTSELGYDFYFQATPTIRFHAPKVKNEFHYPIFHSDPLGYGHPPEEINIWFSLTENKNSGFYVIDVDRSKEWVDTYGVEDFKTKASKARDMHDDFNQEGLSLAKQIESSTECIYLFDSSCIHTNIPRNEETRISMDVRINPVEKFVEGYVGLGNMKAEFKPGGRFGYHKHSIGEII